LIEMTRLQSALEVASAGQIPPTRVIDQNVDPAQCCRDFSNSPRDLRVLDDVSLPGTGPTA
jgi:hypothetical protein